MIVIPYSENAKYYHITLKDKRSFSLFRVVPVWGTDYKGKWRKQGVLVRRGYNAYTRRWENQGLLIPKKYEV